MVGTRDGSTLTTSSDDPINGKDCRRCAVVWWRRCGDGVVPGARVSPQLEVFEDLLSSSPLGMIGGQNPSWMMEESKEEKRRLRSLSFQGKRGVL